MSAAKKQTSAKPDADAPAGPPWTETQWEGHTLYQCRYCSRDTFDRDEIIKHVSKKHPG